MVSCVCGKCCATDPESTKQEVRHQDMNSVVRPSHWVQEEALRPWSGILHVSYKGSLVPMLQRKCLRSRAGSAERQLSSGDIWDCSFFLVISLVPGVAM